MGTGQPGAAPIPTRPKGPMQNRLKPPARLPNAPLGAGEEAGPDRARAGAARDRRRPDPRAGARSTAVATCPGLLSIVVPCYRVEDFLDECLVSLRFQQYREVEIIVVDDGSPDRSGEIARHHARRDLRVRVVTRENGGLSAARNTGIEHARGEFLTFVDSDDVVTPEAYTTAIEALQESGSDFVLSCYDRLEGKKRVPAGTWIRAAHARRRLGVDLDSFPDAMVNAVAWSKTYRRDVLGPGRACASPRASSTRTSRSARRRSRRRAPSTCVPDISVSWRIRNDRSSISQSAWSTRNLAAHNDAVAASFEALRAAGKDRADRDPRTPADLVQHAVLHPPPRQGRPGVLGAAARGDPRPGAPGLARGVRAQRRRARTRCWSS